MYKNLKNVYANVFQGDTDRKLKSVYNNLSGKNGIIAASIGLLLVNTTFKKSIKQKKNNDDLFINRCPFDEKISEVYSDFSSSSYKSSMDQAIDESIRELTEEDVSEIITIVDEDKSLDQNTKKIIKVNTALLLLVQKRMFK